MRRTLLLSSSLIARSAMLAQALVVVLRTRGIGGAAPELVLQIVVRRLATAERQTCEQCIEAANGPIGQPLHALYRMRGLRPEGDLVEQLGEQANEPRTRFIAFFSEVLRCYLLPQATGP